jgi:hypothetical protein
MGRFAMFLVGAVSAAALSGCVERRFIIESNPPGALVYVDGQQKGATPLELPFDNYGKHEFTLVKEGFETKAYTQRIRMPWFEWFPLDFFSENVYPKHIQDNRRLLFDLELMRQPRTEDVVNQGELLRQRGQAIPTPEPRPE